MVEQEIGGSSPSATGPTSTSEAVRAVDARITACAAALNVRYLGSILLREDEVLLCQFQGTADAVREVVTCAEVPFEQIHEAPRIEHKGGRNT